MQHGIFINSLLTHLTSAFLQAEKKNNSIICKFVYILDALSLCFTKCKIKEVLYQQRKNKRKTNSLYPASSWFLLRERNHCEQPSVFPSSMRDFVTLHVIHLMSLHFSLEGFVKECKFLAKSADKRTIHTFVKVLYISSLWSTYKAQMF